MEKDNRKTIRIEKHLRFKVRPVCSDTLKGKCAIFQGCMGRKCTKETACEAAEHIEHHINENGEVIILINCKCAENQYTGRGCPLFRKVGE